MAAAAAKVTMSNTNPFQFLQQVREETAKISWPTQRETVITTVMVFVMALVAAIFFLFADFTIGWAVKLVLGVGR